LTVVGQNFRANLAQSGAILLQTRQHGIVAVVHHGPAMPGHIASASRVSPSALRGRRASDRHTNHRNQWKREKNSGHVVTPAGHEFSEFYRVSRKSGT
jgi:hypothetical protein